MPKVGFKHTEESKIKMSKSRTGVKRPGFSDEWKENISRAHKGRKRPRVTEIGCKICGEKEPSKMVVDKRNFTGLAQVCRSCEAIRRAEEDRYRHIKRSYGITTDDVVAMHKKQGGKCPVCGNDVCLPKQYESVIDHCHASGKFRGILHHKCNLLLGHAKDNMNTLEMAVEYLKVNA